VIEQKEMQGSKHEKDFHFDGSVVAIIICTASRAAKHVSV
jgi:hypothetical protein